MDEAQPEPVREKPVAAEAEVAAGEELAAALEQARQEAK
jgi:hypothetical protein